MDRRSFCTPPSPASSAPGSPPLIRPAFAQDAPAPPPSASTPWSPAPARPRGQPYRRPLMKLTEPFADLKYDQFRAIRFRDDKRLFADGTGRSSST